MNLHVFMKRRLSNISACFYKTLVLNGFDGGCGIPGKFYANDCRELNYLPDSVVYIGLYSLF